MSHQTLAERLQRTIDGRCDSLSEQAEQGAADYDARCEAEVVRLSQAMEERLSAHRADLEQLYARRAAHEYVNAQRHREGQLIEDALASIREKLQQLPDADPTRYRRFLAGLLDEILATREGPMLVLAAERDLALVQRSCAGIPQVEVQADPELQSGLRARETATGASIDASLQSLFERARAELASRLTVEIFGGKATPPGKAADG